MFDVVCTDPRGSQFVVEMQKRTQRYFRDRALYYAAYPIIEQAPKGSWNYRLKPVCVVGILNFAMEHEYGPEAGRWREKLIHRYRLREDETGEIMNSKLEFLYLEVGAFRKEISGSSPATDKWMYALKNLSRLEERPQALRERVFERLFEAARGGADCGIHEGGKESIRERYDDGERLQEHNRLREGRRPRSRACRG